MPVEANYKLYIIIFIIIIIIIFFIFAATSYVRAKLRNFFPSPYIPRTFIFAFIIKQMPYIVFHF